jgi:hypothetical protein
MGSPRTSGGVLVVVVVGSVAAGSVVVAGSVVAGSVVAGSVVAGPVVAGSVAGVLVAGSVTAGSVTAGSVAVATDCAAGGVQPMRRPPRTQAADPRRAMRRRVVFMPPGYDPVFTPVSSPTA